MVIITAGSQRFVQVLTPQEQTVKVKGPEQLPSQKLDGTVTPPVPG